MFVLDVISECFWALFSSFYLSSKSRFIFDISDLHF